MIWLTTGGQERPSTMSCPHLAAKRGRRPCPAHIWRPREAVVGA